MSIFRFKQFSVRQEGATMKINTDGVLLAAFCSGNTHAQKILDIGTGTGVIALMLAQKYAQAKVTAIDIDAQTVDLANVNFESSPFAERMQCLMQDFLQFESASSFDILISNPPYFIDSLKNNDQRKTQSRHTNVLFFESFFQKAFQIASLQAFLWMIFPVQILEQMIQKAMEAKWFLKQQIWVFNHEGGSIIRVIVVFVKQAPDQLIEENFYIRDAEQRYSAQYQEALFPFFL